MKLYLAIIFTFSTICLSPSFSQKNELIKQLNFRVNSWHKAAADADASTFFELMADNCIYIGTDETERWTKVEFKKFAMPYFKKGKAWDFRTKSRNWTFYCEELAIFDELLDTWMGHCRSTGVMRKHKDTWKLEYYHLSVSVPNSIIKDYVKLLEKNK